MALEDSMARTAGRRLTGERATRTQAFLTASVAAVAAGIVVYRLLRSGSEPGSE